MAVTARDASAIAEVLNGALALAEDGQPLRIAPSTSALVARFSENVGTQATAAFTNLVTCLAASAVNPDCDPRFHRQASSTMPPPPDGKVHFSGRSISERVVYPWLASKSFRGAMSGWQTRVFERPAPYLLDYSENISHVRDEFLGILHAVAELGESPTHVLAALLTHELAIRRRISDSKASVASIRIPRQIQISEITRALESQFALPQPSRLPVIAIQSIYAVLMPLVGRYEGARLAPLSEHSAADQHTGAVGDVEVYRSDGSVLDAVEVKHGIAIDDNIVRRSVEKIRRSPVSRYYILSTSDKLRVTEVGTSLIDSLRLETGSHIILNGVVPTIKYFLRLVDDLSQFVGEYGRLLATDRRVSPIHLDAWIASFALFDDLVSTDQAAEE